MYVYIYPWINVSLCDACVSFLLVHEKAWAHANANAAAPKEAVHTTHVDLLGKVKTVDGHSQGHVGRSHVSYGIYTNTIKCHVVKVSMR
jgi:hypothetical protein